MLTARRSGPCLNRRIQRGRDLCLDVFEVHPRRAVGASGDGRLQVRVERLQLTAEERARVVCSGRPAVDAIAERFDVGALEVAAVRIDQRRSVSVHF